MTDMVEIPIWLYMASILFAHGVGFIAGLWSGKR